MANRFRAVGAVFAALLFLCGCSLRGVPTQAHPTCSWASQPPVNADTLCNETFSTLRALAQAEARGDDQTIRRLVLDRPTAERIIADGARRRAGGVRDFHIRPSLTLYALRPGSLAATFYLIGHTRNGKLYAEQTVYFLVRKGAAFVTHDVPLQEW